MREFNMIDPKWKPVVEDGSLPLDKPLIGMVQQLGQRVTSAAMFFMTSTVAYGYNEAVSLRVNHRLCQQRESIHGSGENMPTIEESIMCAADTRESQTFQNGNLQVVPYEAHILDAKTGHHSVAEETMAGSATSSLAIDPATSPLAMDPKSTQEPDESNPQPGLHGEEPQLQEEHAEALKLAEEPARYESLAKMEIDNPALRPQSDIAKAQEKARRSKMSEDQSTIDSDHSIIDTDPKMEANNDQVVVAKFSYTNVKALPLSLATVNSLAIALGVDAASPAIKFWNGAVDWALLLQHICAVPDCGSSLLSLNQICGKLFLPWKYKIETVDHTTILNNAELAAQHNAKLVGRCNRHLQTYIRHITLAEFAAADGNHRMFHINRAFQGRRVGDCVPLFPRAEDSTFPTNSTLCLPLSVDFLYPTSQKYNKESLDMFRIHSYQSQAIRKSMVMSTSYRSLYEDHIEDFESYAGKKDNILQNTDYWKLNGFMQKPFKTGKRCDISQALKEPMLRIVQTYLTSELCPKKFNHSMEETEKVLKEVKKAWDKPRAPAFRTKKWVEKVSCGQLHTPVALSAY